MPPTARADIVRAIEAAGIVAVIRVSDAAIGRRAAEALAEGGVTALEVTMTVAGAVDLIAELSETVPPGVIVGAGTVLDARTAAQVTRAGARFVVSPVFRREVVEAAHRADAAAVPGCFTPTEILSAWDAGADAVKVFPATALGPGYLKDLRGPLPQVRLIPTGGVTLENAGDWIRAGALAIGVGSALVNHAHIERERYDLITALARQFVRAVGDARAPQETPA